ncbi:MAG TPA: hypothetical protein H9860_01450 [Candidatus Gemmiger faecavium]|nr:hypothetical protein [Candidatus Gemmiger faecavium]
MELEILGKKFPMKYTVSAQSEIAKRFGGLEKMAAAMESNGAAKTLEDIVFMAAAMIRGAARYERVKCKAVGEEPEEQMTLTSEELCDAVELKDLKRIREAVMATMKEGQQVTVEVEPSRKNAEATP